MESGLFPLGELSPHYTVGAALGVGGAATVHVAVDKRNGGKVALKALRKELIQQTSIVKRFLKEAKALQTIQHPHLVRIIEVGLMNGLPAIVLELLEGETLEKSLERHKVVPPLICREVLCPVLDALEYAHQIGLIHRDLKPENIFLARVPMISEAFPKLLDFGVAQGMLDGFETVLTLPGETLGTPHYMSPEQAMGVDAIDERVDVYAAGVILYQMLSGKLPYNDNNYNTLIFRIATETPPPLPVAGFVTAEVSAVVARAMAKKVTERYRSVGEMRLEMERVFR